MTTFLKTIELPFVILRFHEGYVVARIKEGVVLDNEKLNQLTRVTHDFYGDKRYVYISERMNNYNVDPMVYPQLVQEENLTGIAIVCSSPSAVSGANFERRFSKVPFEVFMDFQDAREWALELLMK